MMMCHPGLGPLHGPRVSKRVAFSVLWLAICLQALAPASGAVAEDRQPLPPPVVDPHSTEICLNSRLSYHGGWSTGGSDQMLGDVLHAAARAPVTGGVRTLYAATAQNVYIYDAGTHSLVVHRSGDWRSDATAAFEVGVAAESIVDAGAAMHLAQLESVALWSGTAGQLASCPRASAATHANANWNPVDPIDIVISFGVRAVAGLTATLVAVSSDGSLPDPTTDGPVFLDDTLADLAYDSTFAAQDLTLAQLSQLLWASYGCSNHMAAGGKAGLVCSSAVANYYLTRRIYAVTADGVYRYHVRRPPGTDPATRDHRIELVTAGDVRPALRPEVGGLPEAPLYVVLCVGTAGAWQELEVGFAAMGAVLQASAMDLQGHVICGLSADEQAGVREVTGIPTTDIPVAVVSLGHPSGVTDTGNATEVPDVRDLWIESTLASSGQVLIRYGLPARASVVLALYDASGHQVRTLVEARQAGGTHAAEWDCRDGQGQAVSSGVYFCRLTAGNATQSSQVVVVR